MGSPARSASGDLRESAFQGQVIDLARYTGWRVAHFRTARTERGWRTAVAADGAGFVDLVLVRGPELLFVELKTRTGRASSEQREWLDALSRVDQAVQYVLRAARDVGLELELEPLVEVYLWRPADWDAIEVRLKRRPRRPPAPPSLEQSTRAA
jgi:hypothetical protein